MLSSKPVGTAIIKVDSSLGGDSESGIHNIFGRRWTEKISDTNTLKKSEGSIAGNYLAIISSFFHESGRY